MCIRLLFHMQWSCESPVIMAASQADDANIPAQTLQRQVYSACSAWCSEAGRIERKWISPAVAAVHLLNHGNAHGQVPGKLRAC